MKNDLCDIVVVMDRSGSMASIRSDMEGGFDAFMEAQRAVPGECRVTLYQFDDKYECAYERKPVGEVPKCKLEPRGMTALLDAVGRAINTLGATLDKTPEAERPAKVVMMILTDGQENSSHEFTLPQVREMIERQKSIYQWQFVYLGSDPSTFADAGALGIQGTLTSKSAPGTARAYAASASAVASYRTGAKASVALPTDLTDGANSTP